MKAVVGLSGGVDSALAAALLAEQGCRVTGVFLECWREPGCRTDIDRQDALKVALKLKIPFRTLDLKAAYRKKVLERFYREYRAGRTPNPDIWCNQEIKFGLFLDWAIKQDFDYVATGHYAQLKFACPADVRRAQSSPHRYATSSARRSAWVARISLIRPVDSGKDQTYFLAMLKEKQLRRVLFPIGHLTKKQVRAEAKKRNLPVWDKKDSTGICFVGHDLEFKDFLQRKIKVHPGKVIDQSGRVIGNHDGVEFYTIGQRRGFTARVAGPNTKPLFVIQKDIKRNRLIVGEKRELARKEFEVESWHWINPVDRPSLQRSSLQVRIRHQGRLIPCRICGRKVKLDQSEFGLAPGQVAAVYCGRQCLGGGVIE